MSALLSLKHIYKRYGSVAALDDVNLSIDRGEVVGLIGDNGAGKSTIVKVTSGAILSDSGTIVFDGSECSWASPRNALEAGIETLYQDGGLAPHLSVAANLYLGREIFKGGILGRLGILSTGKMAQVARASLSEIGLSTVRAEVPVANLSGGERQAVAIARAVVWAKKLILLDEPTNHLGVKEVAEVLRLIRSVQQRGISVIMISHTLPHVMEVTDRIVVLRLGRVVSEHVTGDVTMERLVSDMTGATGVQRFA
jgi:simple sugar transport system ATP-binding protein